MVCSKESKQWYPVVFWPKSVCVRIKKRRATQRLVGEWKTKVFYQFYNDEYQGRSAWYFLVNYSNDSIMKKAKKKG
jgi:hypothetical protein